MRQSHQLPLLGLLLFSLIPRQQCKICAVSKENKAAVRPLIRTMINSNYTSRIQAANVVLSLRLCGSLNQSQDRHLIEQFIPTVTSTEPSLTSGQLALAILALGACKAPDGISINYSKLVKTLGNKYKAEIKNMEEHKGNPLTNYYQLSLDVLALCLFSGNYSVTEVAELFNPENKNYYFHGQFSVALNVWAYLDNTTSPWTRPNILINKVCTFNREGLEIFSWVSLYIQKKPPLDNTGALAVLALTCVKNKIKGQNQIDGKDIENIDNHIKLLIRKILSQKKKNGLLGNIYSTGEAMQALFVSPSYYNKNQWVCKKTRDTVLIEISRGAFRMPTAAAQILPALMGKTYLDINKDSSCVYGSDTVHISTKEPLSVAPTVSPSRIQVNYSVVIDNRKDCILVSVTNGSVFLNVMEQAQKENPTQFRFTAEETSWGPYITSVRGIKADTNDRTYWELLSNGQPLSQGAGSYVVHAGDDLEVRWSTY